MQFTLIAHDSSKRFFHYTNNEVTQTQGETNFTTNSGVNLMISQHLRWGFFSKNIFHFVLHNT
jgi:hypothetical protein